MTEEFVTKRIMAYLLSESWTIVCFDFPQSGTGKVIHHNDRKNEKVLDSFIPDIVAVKNDLALFFENKNRFYYKDYQKVEKLRTTSDYSNDISNLLKIYSISRIMYGIGLPTKAHKKKSIESQGMVDFILGVNDDGTIKTLFGNPFL